MAQALRLALRDLALFGLTSLALWFDAAALHQGPWALSVAAGLLCALSGFLLHEWGHLAGALWANSKVSFPDKLTSPFLFMFDVSANDARQFLAMSYGGYAGSALAIVALLCVLPHDMLSGHVGITATVLGVIATVALELPTTLRVRRGEGLPVSGPAYVRSDQTEP